MAKFCTQCGKPLAEGQICSCQIKKEERKDILDLPTEEYKQETDDRETKIDLEETKQESQQDYTVLMLKNIWYHILNIAKKPAVYGTNFVETEDTKSAWGIIGLHACLQAVFIMIILQRINGLIGNLQSIIEIFMKEADLGSLGQNAQGILTISLLKGFILTVLLVIILSAAYTGILYGISKLMGQNTSFQKMLCVSAVRSIACMMVLAAAGILFILNSTVGILVFSLGEMFGICYTMAVMPKEIDVNKKVYIVFLSLVIFVIISNFIVLNYIPFYLPDLVKNAYDQLKIFLRNPYAFYNKLGGTF